MFFSATRNKNTIYLKVVNASAAARNLVLNLQGAVKLQPVGKTITISGDKPEATNTISDPENIIPVTAQTKGVGRHFHHSFPSP